MREAEQQNDTHCDLRMCIGITTKTPTANPDSSNNNIGYQTFFYQPENDKTFDWPKVCTRGSAAKVRINTAPKAMGQQPNQIRFPPQQEPIKAPEHRKPRAIPLPPVLIYWPEKITRSGKEKGKERAFSNRLRRRRHRLRPGLAASSRLCEWGS